MTGLDVLIPLIASALGALWGKKTERKKAQADLSGVELDNVDKAVRIWRGLAETLEAKVDELINEIHELRAEMEKLRKENVELKKTLEQNTKSNNT